GAPKDFNPHSPNHPDFPNGFIWHTVSLPGLHSKDAYLADATREFHDPSSDPVQVEAKAGERGQSQAVARSFARTIQAQGFQIGPGGTTVRIEGVVADTEATIQFMLGKTAKIPRCEVSVHWLSQNSNTYWKANRDWSWNMSNSRYKVSEKYEYGPGGFKRYEF